MHPPVLHSSIKESNRHFVTHRHDGQADGLVSPCYEEDSGDIMALSVNVSTCK